MSPRYIMTFSISILALAHLLGLTPTGPLSVSEGMKKGQTHRHMDKKAGISVLCVL